MFKSFLFSGISVVFLIITLSVPEARAHTAEEARATVAAAIRQNILGVNGDDVKVMKNSAGDGFLAYISKGGVRNLVWVVIDGRAYAVNGNGKDLTPGLPWSWEANPGVWKRTGFNRSLAGPEIIEIVHGKVEPASPPPVEQAADDTPGRYVTKENFFACATKTDFEKLNDIVAAKDMAAAELMISGGRCIILKGGVEVQLVDSTWSGAVEIRPIGSLSTVWTYYEAIK